MPIRIICYEGIMFNDITTLLLRPKVFKDTVDLLIERYRGMGITVVAGEKFDYLICISGIVSFLKFLIVSISVSFVLVTQELKQEDSSLVLL